MSRNRELLQLLGALVFWLPMAIPAWAVTVGEGAGAPFIHLCPDSRARPSIYQDIHPNPGLELLVRENRTIILNEAGDGRSERLQQMRTGAYLLGGGLLWRTPWTSALSAQVFDPNGNFLPGFYAGQFCSGWGIGESGGVSYLVMAIGESISDDFGRGYGRINVSTIDLQTGAVVSSVMLPESSAGYVESPRIVDHDLDGDDEITFWRGLLIDPRGVYAGRYFALNLITGAVEREQFVVEDFTYTNQNPLPLSAPDDYHHGTLRE